MFFLLLMGLNFEFLGKIVLGIVWVVVLLLVLFLFERFFCDDYLDGLLE